jgi:hypothetical protein
MVDGGKITLRFEVDGEQFKRVMQEINKEVDKFKDKATGASTSADNLGKGVKSAGEQSASAAINFQTMTQGAINLTTAFAQTYTSVSNIQRAHTSLAQSVVSLERAEDLLQRKQFKLNQEMSKAVPNMEKVQLLQNEISTSMDDYAVKQQKVKDQQDALNDTQLLFAVNLVNVGFSAIQTGKSMIELGKSMNIAATASAIFNSTMGKVAIIATAVILAMEGITAIAKAMNVEWANQIPSLSNLGNMMSKTFTTSDQILANSKKNVEDYGSSWKDVTKKLGDEIKEQNRLVHDWELAQRTAIGNMHIEMGRAFGTTRNFSQAPEKGAVGLPSNVPNFLLPYALAVNRRGAGRQSKGTRVDVTSIFAEADRLDRLGTDIKFGNQSFTGRSFFDSKQLGNPIQFNKDFFEDSTLDSLGNKSIVNEYKKAYANYSRAVINFRQLLKEDPEEFNRLNLWAEMGRAEVAMVEIEIFLEKVEKKTKPGKPDLSLFTSDTSFKSGTDEEVATGFSELALKYFAASKDYTNRARNTDDPKLKSKYRELAEQYKTAGYKNAQIGQNMLARQFDFGTNSGRGGRISDLSSFLNKIGVSGTDFAISQLGFNSIRGDPRVIQGINNQRTRVNLGGQFGIALGMFADMGGVNITGKQIEKILPTLMMSLSGVRSTLKGVAGNPFNTIGPRSEGAGTRFAGRSSSMASRIAGLTAGTGAGRNRAGGHSVFRRDRFGGKIKSLIRDSSNRLASVGFDGFDIGVNRRSFGLGQRVGKNEGPSGIDVVRLRQVNYTQAVTSAYNRALSLGAEYGSLIPVFPFDQQLSDLDNFSTLGSAITQLSNWRNSVQSILSLSFQNQANIEIDARRGRDELEDRLRFQERLEKISSGVSSI